MKKKCLKRDNKCLYYSMIIKANKKLFIVVIKNEQIEILLKKLKLKLYNLSIEMINTLCFQNKITP